MSLFGVAFRKIKIGCIIGSNFCNKFIITADFTRQFFVFYPKFISTFSMTVKSVPIISDFSDLLRIGQLFFINLV